MLKPLRPADLPAPWFERWAERGALVQEMSDDIPNDASGVREADSRAFRLILTEMEMAGCFQQSLYA